MSHIDRGHGKQVYKGEFQEGLRHGTGTLTVPFTIRRGKGPPEDDWAMYQGGWNKGQRHGNGKWLQPDGAEYEGEYKFDKMWGVGTWRSRDGDVYEGRFKDNIRFLTVIFFVVSCVKPILYDKFLTICITGMGLGSTERRMGKFMKESGTGVCRMERYACI